jgi:hypothetical protein
MKVNEAASPFVDSDAQRLKNTSLYQIVGIFCIAILVKGELFSKDFYLSFASVVLLTWNIAAYLCAVAFHYFCTKWIQYFPTSIDLSREVELTNKALTQSDDIEKSMINFDSDLQISTWNPLSNDRCETEQEVGKDKM